MGEVTPLIERARGGSREAFDRIFELLYPELRQIAHRRLARVVEMRYFVGMDDAEIAEALNQSKRTVTRDGDKARLLLAHALRS